MGLFDSFFSSNDEPAEIQLDEPIRKSPVLIVEDDPVLAWTIREFLETYLYRVTIARDGSEGVRHIMQQPFEIIICDMMMPKLPGDMFYRAVERINENLCPRFIFITGHQGNCKVTDFIREVRGYSLIKPFQLGRLLEIMRLLETSTPSPVKDDLRGRSRS